jgi:outer membrane biosynthesis protein TonB
LPTAPGTPPQAAIATERVDRRRTMPIVGVVFGLAIAAGGTAYIVANRPGPATPATNESKPVEAKPVEAKPVEAKPVEAKPVEAKPVEAKPVEAKPVEAKPVETSKPKTETKPDTRAETKPETLSPAAASDLAEAQAALDAGKSADAIRLAQHSLYAQKSSRAYAIIARARCAQGDLGNAKAALARVAARDRSAVIRDCGKLGTDIH